MENQRKQYTAEFKLKVVLESLQRDTTIEEVSKKFGVSTSMIHRWRQEFQAKAATIFVDKRDPKQNEQAQGYTPGESPDDLKKSIGELMVQNDILKRAMLLRSTTANEHWYTVGERSRQQNGVYA